MSINPNDPGLGPVKLEGLNFGGTYSEVPLSGVRTGTTAFGLLVAVGELPLQSIAAGSSAIANGSALDSLNTHSNHAMIITAAGAPSAGAVQLQGSHDGTNWVNLGAAVNIAAAGVTMQNVQGAPMRYLRAAITVAIVGGTVGVTTASAG